MKLAKRTVSAAIALIMAASCIQGFADGGIYTADSFTAGTNSSKADGGVWYRQPYGFFYIADVRLDGVKSVAVTAKNNMYDKSDGERIILRLDGENGDVIGYVDIDRHCPDEAEVFYGSLEKAVSGTHSVYFQSLIANNNSRSVTIYSAEFLNEAYKKEPYIPVPDSAIRDVHQSTWALTDDLGRRAATYEETGPLREDKKVGMFYWTWHREFETSKAFNNSEFAKEHPEAKHDYYNTLWPTTLTNYFWNEPVFGYYSGIDYWVYRKHAEMLASAGVDALFFDTTNGRWSWRREYTVLLSALHDSRADGVNAPKVCFVTNFSSKNAEAKENIKRIYIGAYKEDKWSDLWFYWEGKPLILA